MNEITQEQLLYEDACRYISELSAQELVEFWNYRLRRMRFPPAFYSNDQTLIHKKGREYLNKLLKFREERLIELVHTHRTMVRESLAPMEVVIDG